MKKFFLFLTFALLISASVFTNPSPELHKSALKTKFNDYLQQSMKENNLGETGQTLGMMLGGFVIDPVINQIVSVDNYVLFSTTKITWDGETNVVGIGIFGNVFLSEKIDEALKNGLLKK